jgi:hypothetical protein
LPNGMRRPERSEAADYYFRYIDQVDDADIVRVLASQREKVVERLRGVPESLAGHSYEPGKWTLREVVGHINDTERLFCARAFWFARGFDTHVGWAGGRVRCGTRCDGHVLRRPAR